MLKKLTLLALSVAALVAFAVPATASAGWTVNEEALTADTTVEFTGHAQFTVFGLVGATAETVHIKVTLEPGSTGKVTSFVVTGCKGILGYKAFTCDASTPTLEEKPWVVHCNAGGSISITEIDVHNKYTGEGTPPADSTLTGGVNATPAAGTSNTISTVTLSSNGANVGGNPAVVSGDLTVSAPHTGIVGCA